MPFPDSANQSKRTATSPLSEGEDSDYPYNRRSRMKRINPAEVLEDQDLPPDGGNGGENGNLELGATATVPCSTSAEDKVSTETDPKTKIEEKEPVTLESLSGKSTSVNSKIWS